MVENNKASCRKLEGFFFSHEPYALETTASFTRLIF